MSAIGRREQKKAETKYALSRGALTLMLERGVDGVNGDQIAEAAGVAPRTFRNYFASKEEAVLFNLERVQLRFVEAFLARSAKEHVIDSLQAAALDLIDTAGPVEDLIAITRLMAENPSLVVHRFDRYRDATKTMLREIAARTGTDPNVDLYPRLVERGAACVIQSVVEMFAGQDVSPELLETKVREGFAQLRRGLARPLA